MNTVMDPERVRAYLQAACAGLGFDVGEVWWTSNESGSSTLAAIEERHDENDPLTEGVVASASIQQEHQKRRKKRIRFLQLYTSKSFGDQRSKLVSPPSEKKNGGDEGNKFRRSNSSADLEKHVLSPRLVEAISSTAQVVWANCQKREGLLGRSDVRLQTAVGMPVAVDADGNMVIVVMFSPNNVQSSDEAMEYLQYISKSAVSSSIPCLLPVVDQSAQNAIAGHSASSPQHKHLEDGELEALNSSGIIPQDLGEGVTARFVSFHNGGCEPVNSPSPRNRYTASPVEVHTVHELSAAPKDCYGIPMLPPFAELGNTIEEEPNEDGSASPMSHGTSEAFDEASYGVWSTIMNTAVDDFRNTEQKRGKKKTSCRESGEISPDDDILLSSTASLSNQSRQSSSSSLPLTGNPSMTLLQRERLEEFASAFLGMSVFDAADVWIPSEGEDGDIILCHVTSVTATESNEGLNYFKSVSIMSSVKTWSGAVGRAYGSGNPVWSTNKDVIVDTNRAVAFHRAKIKTALAVPIFSSRTVSPTCVLCCYSLVRTDSVPFVLRFVQQALRLLWEGLDRIEPHESVGKELWRDVAPADLGEMAADIEMQKAFLVKKRPHDDIIYSPQDKASACSAVPSNRDEADTRDRSSSLSLQLQTLDMLDGDPSVPLQASALYSADKSNVPAPKVPVAVPAQKVQTFVQQAVRSIGDAVPWSSVATNENGTKRAHLMAAPASAPDVTRYQQLQQKASQIPEPNAELQCRVEPQSLSQIVPQSHNPLPHPQPLISPLQQLNAFAPPPSQNQSHQSQTGTYVNASSPAYLNTPTDVGNHRNVPGVVGQEVVKNDHKEDPATALANIEAFNAMARMQAAGNTTGAVYQAQPDPSSNSPHWVDSAGNVGQVGTSDGTAAPAPPTAPVSSMEPNNPTVVRPDDVVSTNGGFCLPTEPRGIPSVVYSMTKPCRIQGCNELCIARRPYCLRHSGNRMCEHDGCTKCAQGATRFCIAHGGGRRCTYPGCDKGARDKFFCAAHGGGKRCIAEGCNKSAVGGSSLCTSHGGGRRCAVDGCEKSAQSSTKYCVKHGGGKKCAHSGCEKVARGRTSYCAAHGGGVRCKLEGCNRVAIGKLQLCRAHGGGSKSRGRTSHRGPSAVPHAETQSSTIQMSSIFLQD